MQGTDVGTDLLRASRVRRRSRSVGLLPPIRRPGRAAQRFRLSGLLHLIAPCRPPRPQGYPLDALGFTPDGADSGGGPWTRTSRSDQRSAQAGMQRGTGGWTWGRALPRHLLDAAHACPAGAQSSLPGRFVGRCVTEPKRRLVVSRSGCAVNPLCCCCVLGSSCPAFRRFAEPDPAGLDRGGRRPARWDRPRSSGS